MENTKTWKNEIIISTTIGVVVLFLATLFLYLFQSVNDTFEYCLDDSWDVYIDGELTYKNASFDEILLKDLPKNTVIDLNRVLGENMNGGYSICMPVFLSAVEVYLDEEPIYAADEDRIGQNVMINSRFHFIDLPNEVDGKLLNIKIIFNQNNAFTGFESTYATKTSLVHSAFANTTFSAGFIGTFMVMMGVIMMIVSMIEVVVHSFDVRLFSIGVFSLTTGAWIVFYNRVLQVYIPQIGTSSLEYLAMYLTPIPFFYLLHDMRKHDRIVGKMTLFFTILFLVFDTVASILHFANIFRFPDTLGYFHAIVFIAVVLILGASVFVEHAMTKTNVIMTVAIVIFMMVIIFDIVRFKMQKLLFPNSHILARSYIPVGALIFVILIILSYLMYVYEIGMSKNEKDVLLRLAYHDVMSGLFNRAKYEEEIELLTKVKMTYAIIAFDVNGLKLTNDTLGHEQGDLLLKSFSSILKKNFEDIGLCFRIGGDEFSVVIIGDNISLIDGRLQTLVEDETNFSKDLDFNIQASYGVAYSNELENNSVKEILKFADERMYNMKFKLKEAGYNTIKVKNN